MATNSISQNQDAKDADVRGGGLRAIVWNFRILIIGLVLLIGAIGISEARMGHWEVSILWKPETYLEVLKEVGFALIIAFLISMGIERSARREFNLTVNKRMRDIQQQVFLSTYGRNVPANLIDEVELLVLNADFTRHGHRLTYDLQMLKATELAAGKVAVPDISVVVAEVNMTYEVENISTISAPYTIEMVLEIPPFEGLAGFVKFKNIAIGDHKLTQQEIEQKLSTRKGAIVFQQTVPTILPNQRLCIKGTWQAIKSVDDVELWQCVLPSDGITLCVRFPKEVQAHGAAALHRNELSEQTIGDGPYQEWSIRGGVLPHQGIVFWWRCSNPPIVPATQPASATPLAQDAAEA